LEGHRKAWTIRRKKRKTAVAGQTSSKKVTRTKVGAQHNGMREEKKKGQRGKGGIKSSRQTGNHSFKKEQPLSPWSEGKGKPQKTDKKKKNPLR